MEISLHVYYPCLCKISLLLVIEILWDTSCNNLQVDITRLHEDIELSYSYIFGYVLQLTVISFSSLILFMSHCINHYRVLNKNSKLNSNFWHVD